MTMYIPDYRNTLVNQDLVQKDLRKKNIQWFFIPAKAARYGGSYERIIGLI